MGKFYKFINESKRVQRLTESDAKEIVRFNCKKSANGTPIYRGTNFDSSEFGYGDPRGKIRTSANTSNFYTLIMSNSKPWKNYPPRNESFICTLDYGIAMEYGSNAYRVIPYDGTPIGVCNGMDLWDSFRDFESISEFNSEIEDLAEKFNLNLNKMNSDYKYLLKALDKIGENIREEEKYIARQMGDMKDFLKGFIKQKRSLSEYTIKILSPNYNNFKLRKPETIEPGSDDEVWFSGKAVFIDIDKEDEILDIYDSILKWANDVDESKKKQEMVT